MPHKFIDMSGQRFGRLTAIEKVGTSKTHNGEALWSVRCDCGTVKKVTRTSLRRGDTKSCGCLGRKKILCRICGLEFTRPEHRMDKFCGRDCYRKSMRTKALSIRTEPFPPPVRGCRWIRLNRGFALVDKSDYKELSKYLWMLNASGYAVAKIDGRRSLMHRMVLGDTSPEDVDHKNRNRLDNRASNLRYVSGGINRVNSRNNISNTSGYRGVSRHSNSKSHPWVSRIGFNMKRLHLGTFVSAEDAAKAYDVAADKLFGGQAQLNFPKKKVG